MYKSPYFDGMEVLEGWDAEDLSSRLDETLPPRPPRAPYVPLVLPKPGDVFKSYTDMCKTLGYPIYGGDQKKKQLRRLGAFFEMLPTGNRSILIGKVSPIPERIDINQTKLSMNKLLVMCIFAILSRKEAGEKIGALDLPGTQVVLDKTTIGIESGFYNRLLPPARSKPEVEADDTSEETQLALTRYKACVTIDQKFTSTLYKAIHYTESRGLLEWKRVWLICQVSEETSKLSFGEIDHRKQAGRKRRLATEEENAHIALELEAMMRGGAEPFVVAPFKKAPKTERDVMVGGYAKEFYSELNRRVWEKLGLYISHKHWHVTLGDSAPPLLDAMKGMAPHAVSAWMTVVTMAWFDDYAWLARTHEMEVMGEAFRAFGIDMIQSDGAEEAAKRHCDSVLKLADRFRFKNLAMELQEDPESIRIRTKEERALEEAQLVHPLFVFRHGEEEAEAALANRAAEARRSLEHLF